MPEITTTAQFEKALGHARAAQINKASVANQVSGAYSSLWRASGVPAAPGIPGAADFCYRSTSGSLPLIDPSGADVFGSYYLAEACLTPSAGGITVEIHDRLAHCGGLSGIVTTAQTVGIDASSPLIAERIGRPDFRGLSWWTEHYADTGSTAVSATLAGTTNLGNSLLYAFAPFAATTRAGRLVRIINPGQVVAPEGIKSISTLTLNATSGTAGNFGVTLTRRLCSLRLDIASVPKDFTLDDIGVKFHPDSCLMMMVYCNTTATGSLVGSIKAAEGV